MKYTTSPGIKSLPIIPLMPEGRVSVWERVRGMWKNRKPDPIQELKKMRKEWERELSSTR